GERRTTENGAGGAGRTGLDRLRRSHVGFGAGETMKTIFALGLVWLTAAQWGVAANMAPHTFTVGDKDFLLDGKPLQIRCGEIHFARVPREYWRQRLKLCRAMGLNAVCEYLFWNYHEW